MSRPNEPHKKTMWKCQLCGEMLETAQEANDHVEQEHAKEMARMHVESLMKSVKSTDDVDKQLMLREAIAEYTRKFLINETDNVPAYTFEEALGNVPAHEMWQRVMDCGYPNCVHNEPDAHSVDNALSQLNRGTKKNGRRPSG